MKTAVLIILSMFAVSAFAQKKAKVLGTLVVKPYDNGVPGDHATICDDSSAANLIVYSQVDSLEFHSNPSLRQQPLYNSSERKYILCISPNTPYTIRIRAKNFAVRKWQIEPVEPRSISYYLVNPEVDGSANETNRAGFKIESSPSNAQFTILESNVSGYTPYTFNDLRVGIYHITFEKLGFHDLTSEFSVFPQSSGVPNFKVFKLMPLMGSVTVRFKHHLNYQANVFVDDSLVGRTPLNRRQLAVGNHAMRIADNEDNVYYKNVFINEGDETYVDIKLNRNSKQKQGTIGLIAKQLVLPGLNRTQTPGQHYGRLIMRTFIASVSLGIAAHLYSNYEYNRYVNKRDGNRNDLYNQANTSNQIYVAAAAVAITLYSFDLLSLPFRSNKHLR